MRQTGFIPFSVPEIGEEEIAAVIETLQSGWLTTGRRAAQFEREFRAYVGAREAVATSSCTAALHLALEALGVGPGDEVITSPLTFCATVNAILYTGATPVLADVGADGNLCPQSVGERIGARTRALLPVHLAGLPCDLDALWNLARRHNLHVVEDAAHAAGSLYRGRPIGATDPRGLHESDAVAFSFYATKNLTTGEGGALTTPREALAERIRSLGAHGISKNAWNRHAGRGNWFYQVESIGFKYNLTDLQAAIGIQQLRKLDGFIAARQERARWYHEALAGIEELELPTENDRSRHSWHLYTLRLRLEKLAIGREEFMDELQRRGIGASVHFIPIPLHPAYASRPTLAAALCPRAMEIYPRLVSLPLYPSLTSAQVARVAAAVKEIVGKAKKRKQVAGGLETAALAPAGKGCLSRAPA